LSNIRVRRSGLVSFFVKSGSLLTGLIFVVIVTSHLPTAEFGLWSLIGRTMSYTLLPTSILTFWTTRYRARGQALGRTILVGSGFFSIFLTVIFLIISIPIAATIHSQVSSQPNVYYFFLSSPQIFLYTFAGSFEALLWATSPERNSLGFASFEVAKVLIGFFTIDILHLTLTGAILTLVFAQGFQFILTVFLTRHEYKDKISLKTISRMIKTGWLAVLNNLGNLLKSFDFLVITAFTGSANLLALFAAAVVIATATSYSSYLGQGLYPSILRGGDAKSTVKQVFELQLVFLSPMILGAIFLRTQLLKLLNPAYIYSADALTILVIANAFESLQALFESTLTASDTTDVSENVKVSAYMKSKLFLVSKINLSLATAYLTSLVIIGLVFAPRISSSLATNNPILSEVAVVWAIVNVIISFTSFVLKAYYARRLAPFSLDFELIRALVFGSVVFAVVMYFIGAFYIPPQKSEVTQALNIFAIGIFGLAIYFGIVGCLSKTVRSLIKAMVSSVMSLVF
jgi:O-antigen/teichoic acid export membrane protein